MTLPYWTAFAASRPRPRIITRLDRSRYVLWTCPKCEGPKSHDCTERAEEVLALVLLNGTCVDCAQPSEGRPEPGQQMVLDAGHAHP